MSLEAHVFRCMTTHDVDEHFKGQRFDDLGIESRQAAPKFCVARHWKVIDQSVG